LFGWSKKVKEKKVRGKIVEGMKEGRMWEDCLVVWYKWKWEENEKKERHIFY